MLPQTALIPLPSHEEKKPFQQRIPAQGKKLDVNSPVGPLRDSTCMSLEGFWGQSLQTEEVKPLRAKFNIATKSELFKRSSDATFLHFLEKLSFLLFIIFCSFLLSCLIFTLYYPGTWGQLAGVNPVLDLSFFETDQLSSILTQWLCLTFALCIF